MRIARCAALAAILGLLAGQAQAELSAEAVEAAEFTGGAMPSGQSPLVLKLQVLLDRVGVSPGVIDGYWGGNTVTALRAFEQREGLAADGELDPEAWSRLARGAPGPILAEYTVTAADADGPFVEAIPEDFAQMAGMERLAYTSPGELVAERFHMAVGLFARLNGGLDLAAGDTVLVAQPGEPATGRIARIEVSKSESHVRGFDEAGNMLSHYPATVGSDRLPSLAGSHEVAAVVHEPNYTYDPEKNFQQGDNTETLVVPPGPNGPVGLVWIDLSKPTYGIHGTAKPAEIGKTASHGCVRLTNWDAEELAGRIEEGVPVIFGE